MRIYGIDGLQLTVVLKAVFVDILHAVLKIHLFIQLSIFLGISLVLCKLMQELYFYMIQ